MLLLTKTCEIVTEESAENGEAAEAWVDWEDSESTIREAAAYIKGLEPSQHPITNPANVWFTAYGEADFLSGDVENFSIHYSRNNPAKNLKHWIAAVRLAGFKIQ